MTNSYVNFIIRAKHALQALDYPELDQTSKQLLDEIAIRSSQNLAITVGDLLVLESIGSHVTLHKKFLNLIKLGFVETTHHGDNRRTKYVNLTPKADKYYNQLEKALKKAAGNA
jgi:DNA-binding MarR family transcriptional regulator